MSDKVARQIYDFYHGGGEFVSERIRKSVLSASLLGCSVFLLSCAKAEFRQNASPSAAILNLKGFVGLYQGMSVFLHEDPCLVEDAYGSCTVIVDRSGRALKPIGEQNEIQVTKVPLPEGPGVASINGRTIVNVCQGDYFYVLQ